MNYIEIIICAVIGAVTTAAIIKVALLLMAAVTQAVPAIEAAEALESAAPMLEQIMQSLPA